MPHSETLEKGTDLYKIVAVLALDTFITTTRYEIHHRTLPNGASEYVSTARRVYRNTPSVFHTEELSRGFGLDGHTAAKIAVLDRHQSDCQAWLKDLKSFRPRPKRAAVAQGTA